ncbi:MAG TPA: hypothetical protein VIG99_06120 [Myxococcaceae bacterium]
MPPLIVLTACAAAHPLPELPAGTSAEINASLDGAPVLQGVGRPSMCAELSRDDAVQFGLAEGRTGCPVREIRGGAGTVIDRVSMCQELMVEVKEAKVGARQAVDGSTRAQVWYVRDEAPRLRLNQPGWITIERLETLSDGRRFVQFTARLEAEHVFSVSGWVVATPESCLRASLGLGSGRLGRFTTPAE